MGGIDGGLCRVALCLVVADLERSMSAGFTASLIVFWHQKCMLHSIISSCQPAAISEIVKRF